MDSRKYFQELLDRYRSGDCTESELRELLSLLDEDPSLYRMMDDHVDKNWWLQMGNLRFEERKVDPVIKNQSTSRRIWLWSAAASILVLIVAGIIWWTSDTDLMTTYVTGFGERQQIILPDGSSVELNANTRLLWSNDWEKTGIRKVILEGEAYFDVVKSTAKEFRVHSDEMVVKVLGTSFNVSNRRGETRVFLHEGKVRLDVNGEEVEMLPGDNVRFTDTDKKIKKIKNETLYSAAAWKIGVLSYQKMPLNKILPELSDIFGITLTCGDSSLNIKVMDIGVPYMDWNATKEALELAMKVRIEENQGTFIVTSAR